jgi:hypothetical protein
MNRFTVIDEADELLSTGWEEAMEKLFSGSGMLTTFFLCVYPPDVLKIVLALMY